MEDAIHGQPDGLFGQTNNSDRLAHDDEATLLGLRQDLDRVIANWSVVLSQAAERSAAIASETVSARPWASVAIAASIGALLAVALTPTRKPIDQSRIAVGVTARAPLALQSPWTVDTQPLMSRLSQTWDSIAALNTNSLPALPSVDVLTSFVKAMLPAKPGI
jgi:hypothetical protein